MLDVLGVASKTAELLTVSTEMHPRCTDLPLRIREVEEVCNSSRSKQ